MQLPDQEKLLAQGRAYLSCSLDALASLPCLSFRELDAGRTALILVDLVEGFARQGALASSRVEALIPGAVTLTDRCSAAGMKIVALADCHTPDSLELQSYPPHCLRGTEEARLCHEVEKAAGSYTLIEKNSTNGLLEPTFDSWRKDCPGIDTYIVIGDCTDICVQQFALAAKAWHNTRNLPLRVIVPVSLVDTFDADGHPADFLNVVSLMMMQSGGVEIVREIE